MEEKIKKKPYVKKALSNAGTYIFLSVWAIIVLFPFYWMLLTSIKSYSSYNLEYVPKFYATNPTFQNYLDAFTSVNLARYFLNTFVFTVVTTAIMLIITVLSAFAFAWLNFKGKNVTFALFLALMMIPTELVVITNYVTITNWGLRNTYAGLILPSVASVFTSICLKKTLSRCQRKYIKPPKWTVQATLSFYLRS